MIETSQNIKDITTFIVSVAILISAIAGLAPFVRSINKFLADRHKRLRAAQKATKSQKPNSKTTKKEGDILPRPWSRRTALLFTIICLILLGSQFFSTTVTPGTVAGCVSSALTIIVIALTELAYLILRTLLSLSKGQISLARAMLRNSKSLREMATLHSRTVAVLRATLEKSLPAIQPDEKKPN
jgi:hypothetical protein